MTVGCVGAHRVGKSSLSRVFAEKQKWTFAETSVSQIFKELGHSPSDKFDFKTRLTIQEQILIRLNEFYKKTSGAHVITDRTPIDMLAYTMAEAVGDAVLPEDQERFIRYANDCFDVTNKWFSCIIVVQPGIPLVHEEGKAVLNGAYIEHLNALIMGLCNDQRLSIPHYYIPKNRIDMGERVQSVEFVTGRTFDMVCQESSGNSVFH